VAGRPREVVAAALALRRALATLRFAAPVTHVYNPLDYAWGAYREYLERYACGSREVLLLGMNAGPWGMAQTGVPFGDPGRVRGWLGLSGRIGRPPNEHPRVRVRGFASPRREVSGHRLWGWAAERFGTPERFFARFAVLNYCPLCFLEASGRNRTPDRLPASERGALFAPCDRALSAVIAALAPRFCVGVGRFAAERLAALAPAGALVGRVPHPSPASPAANRDWAGSMTRALGALGVPLD